MITKTKYVKATGELLYTQSGPEEVVLFIEDENYAWIDGEPDIKKYRVVAGSLVLIPTKEVEAKEIEQAWVELRNTRDRKLAACDWTQVPDAPVDQEAWKVYRQQLRDFPETVTDPRTPTWPTQP
jgi:hypothetical protein